LAQAHFSSTVIAFRLPSLSPDRSVLTRPLMLLAAVRHSACLICLALVSGPLVLADLVQISSCEDDLASDQVCHLQTAVRSVPDSLVAGAIEKANPEEARTKVATTGAPSATRPKATDAPSATTMDPTGVTNSATHAPAATTKESTKEPVVTVETSTGAPSVTTQAPSATTMDPRGVNGEASHTTHVTTTGAPSVTTQAPINKPSVAPQNATNASSVSQNATKEKNNTKENKSETEKKEDKKVQKEFEHEKAVEEAMKKEKEKQKAREQEKKRKEEKVLETEAPTAEAVTTSAAPPITEAPGQNGGHILQATAIAPFGKEDTSRELQRHAARTQDTLVDAIENAEVAEVKRSVFRALTRLRAAEIKEFDTIARLETQAIDEYNDNHAYRKENPIQYISANEAKVAEDKYTSFHD